MAVMTSVRQQTIYAARCIDCEGVVKEFRMRENRDNWATGHARLTSVAGSDPHYVKSYEWMKRL